MEMNVALEQAVAEATKNGRVCPKPEKWDELWSLLTDPSGDPDRKPAAPLIHAAWSETTDREKTVRLRAHLAWAARHGCLDPVVTFMRSLPESAWHHAGERGR
jgi:hypothetical protein